jgi:hypothetical protein
MTLRRNLADNIKEILNEYNDLIKLSLISVYNNIQLFNSQFFINYRNLFLKMHIHQFTVFMC